MRHPTEDQEVASSTPAEFGNILSWRLIMKISPPKTENFQIKILIFIILSLKTEIVGTR